MSTLVRIRGLPWGAGEQEICSFFEPLELHRESAVTLVNGPGGRPTGEAFVRFSTTEIQEEALRYNREMLGKRYIEVFPATEQDLQHSVQRQGIRDFSDGILRCRGLPFNCEANDVAEFFSEYGVTEESVTLGVHISGQFVGGPNGEAWVKFKDEAMAKTALEAKNMKTLGTRYVELYLSSEAERQQFQMFAQPTRPQSWGLSAGRYDNRYGRAQWTADGFGFRPQQGRGGFRGQQQRSDDVGECWLRARGLPYSCTIGEVVEFFSGHKVGQHDVIMGMGADGRPTGEALIRFLDTQTADCARQALHRQLLGARYVELFLANPTDWMVFQYPGLQQQRVESHQQQMLPPYGDAYHMGCAGMWNCGGAFAYGGGGGAYSSGAPAPYGNAGDSPIGSFASANGVYSAASPAAAFQYGSGSFGSNAGMYGTDWGPGSFPPGGTYMAAYPASPQQQSYRQNYIQDPYAAQSGDEAGGSAVVSIPEGSGEEEWLQAGTPQGHSQIGSGESPRGSGNGSPGIALLNDKASPASANVALSHNGTGPPSPASAAHAFSIANQALETTPQLAAIPVPVAIAAPVSVAPSSPQMQGHASPAQPGSPVVAAAPAFQAIYGSGAPYGYLVAAAPLPAGSAGYAQLPPTAVQY